MIREVQCPPDGPMVGFDSRTGEKYGNCIACRRCGGCARGGFVSGMNLVEGLM